MTDQEVVSRFLRATSELSDAEAGELIGASYETVRRWRADEWSRLNKATRRSVLRFLGTLPGFEVIRQGTGEPFAVREPDIDYDAEGYGSDFQDLLRSEALLFQQLRTWGQPGKRSDDKLSLIDLLRKVAADMKMNEGVSLDVSHLDKAWHAIVNGKL